MSPVRARSSQVACLGEMLPGISCSMKTTHPVRLRCLIALFLAGLSAGRAQTATDADWPHYGNDEGGMRYSKLTQINRDNVSRLKPAWTLHTGDISDGSGQRERSGLETTPIMVDGTLYVTSAFNRVIAVDPATGTQRWAYDPHIDQSWESGDGLINRGVATWVDPDRPAQKPCHRRIFEATIDARLIALDASKGTPCPDFGTHGQISLRNVPGFRSGWYHITSPPAVIDDIVVVGSAIDDNGQADMPSGVVRAFDARTGGLRWSWDPIPPRGSTPGTLTGAANAWSVMVVDQQRDLVFVPTGSASPDYYGGLRPGDDKWADSVVALHAKTGEMAWGFQLVHHDLWDYDTASPPLLTIVPHDGQRVPVVIQGNKTGFLYVLNRDTGKPLFPVVETPVPQSDVPGEVTSPTQPIPSAPPPLAPQHVSEKDVWGLTTAERETCRTELHALRNEGIFTPPTLKGTLAIPGNMGGMTWSGYAFDPERNLLISNTNNYPFKIKVIPQAEFAQARKGEEGEYTAQRGTPYGMFRHPFRSPQNLLSCVPPPWGMLTAVDMVSGTIRWQIPFGSFDPAAPPGALNFGGPIVTAGGIVLIAGTFDPFMRAFDIETGKLLWQTKLPSSGHATPMTYQYKGKQYVVIAAGGHARIHEEPQSDAIVAFTLP
jgi:quinoprotein glucose dehydrogenase